MGKAEKGTPKDIAKRIKAKGLQKLKFWCQVCEKQCRDANGFKCHLTSESHLRQIKLFSEQMGGRLNSYSREFESNFLSTLRVRHTTTEVNANHVYQEVIQDRQHVHMNATIWATLTDFVKYLGKTGKCHVRETDRGWYVSYIEQDASKLAQQIAYQERHEAEREAEMLESERLKRQRIEAARALGQITGAAREPQPTGLDPDRGSAVKVTIKSKSSSHGGPLGSGVVAASTSVVFSDDEEDDDGEGHSKDIEVRHEPSPSVPLPAAVTSLAVKKDRPKPHPAEPAKKKENEILKGIASQSEIPRSSSWLLPDILVRIVDKKSPYDGRKAIVNRVHIDDDAVVTVLDSGRDRNDGGEVVRVRGSTLETVIPKEGKRVRILLEGPYRGQTAIAVKLAHRKNRATLRLDETDEVLERVHFDDFSKAA
jgi:DNA/RNA-binding protein KIN17